MRPVRLSTGRGQQRRYFPLGDRGRTLASRGIQRFPASVLTFQDSYMLSVFRPLTSAAVEDIFEFPDASCTDWSTCEAREKHCVSPCPLRIPGPSPDPRVTLQQPHTAIPLRLWSRRSGIRVGLYSSDSRCANHLPAVLVGKLSPACRLWLIRKHDLLTGLAEHAAGDARGRQTMHLPLVSIVLRVASGACRSRPRADITTSAKRGSKSPTMESRSPRRLNWLASRTPVHRLSCLPWR